MDITKAIIKVLKPKVQAYGFNKKELEGVAAKIADKLDLEEDATDEDVETAITNEVNAAIPYLQFSQSVSTRVINDFKKSQKKVEEEEETIEEQEAEDKSTPAWAKSMLQSFQQLTNEVTALKSEKLTDTRRSKVQGILKDMGSFGASKLRDFGRMKFENDEEFDEYIESLNEDVKAYNQERADAGLGALGAPGQGAKKQETEEPLSDADIEAIASTF